MGGEKKKKKRIVHFLKFGAVSRSVTPIAGNMSETFCRVMMLPATNELVTSDWFFDDAFEVGVVDSGDESGEIFLVLIQFLSSQTLPYLQGTMTASQSGLVAGLLV